METTKRFLEHTVISPGEIQVLLNDTPPLDENMLQTLQDTMGDLIRPILLARNVNELLNNACILRSKFSASFSPEKKEELLERIETLCLAIFHHHGRIFYKLSFDETIPLQKLAFCLGTNLDSWVGDQIENFLRRIRPHKENEMANMLYTLSQAIALTASSKKKFWEIVNTTLLNTEVYPDSDISGIDEDLAPAFFAGKLALQVLHDFRDPELFMTWLESELEETSPFLPWDESFCVLIAHFCEAASENGIRLPLLQKIFQRFIPCLNDLEIPQTLLQLVVNILEKIKNLNDQDSSYQAFWTILPFCLRNPSLFSRVHDFLHEFQPPAEVAVRLLKNSPDLYIILRHSCNNLLSSNVSDIESFFIYFRSVLLHNDGELFQFLLELPVLNDLSESEIWEMLAEEDKDCAYAHLITFVLAPYFDTPLSTRERVAAGGFTSDRIQDLAALSLNNILYHSLIEQGATSTYRECACPEDSTIPATLFNSHIERKDAFLKVVALAIQSNPKLHLIFICQCTLNRQRFPPLYREAIGEEENRILTEEAGCNLLFGPVAMQTLQHENLH